MGQRFVGWRWCWVLLVLISVAGDHGREILCRHCGAKIGTVEDVVRIGGQVEDGEEDQMARQRFTNPNEVPFEVVTVKEAAVDGEGRFENAATFYENYDWQVVKCSKCMSHLGWMYKLSKDARCGHDHQHAKEPPQKRKEKNHDDDDVYDKYTLEWALSSLRGICLEKEFGVIQYELCFEKAVKLVHKRDSKELVLGNFDPESKENVDLLSKPQFIKMSGRHRRYHPTLYEAGAKCKGSQQRFSTKVSYFCCDSFEMNEDNMDRIQENNLRIETCRQVNSCQHELIVCVPKLCMVNGFAVRDGITVSRASHLGNMHTNEKVQMQKNSCPLPYFYGLIWDNILVEGSVDYQWIESVQPTL